MSGRKVWVGPITMSGTQSEDRRIFDVFQTRTMPLSFRGIVADSGGHNDALAIGTVEAALEGDGGLTWGAGYFDEGDQAAPFIERVQSRSQRYVSIDGIALEDAVSEAIDPETGKVVDREVIYAAYAEAEDALYADDAEKYGEIMAWLDTLTYRTRYPLTQIAGLTLLTIPCFEQAQIEVVGDESEITPADALTAAMKDSKKKPVMASAAVEGPSIDPPTEAERPAAQMGNRLIAAGAPEPTQLYAHGGPILMPAPAYRLEDLAGPTPFTIANNGFMGGHIATTGVCHRSWGDRCQLMPENDDMGNFALGSTPLDDGTRVETGIITYGGPHAPDEIGDLPAEIHRRMEDIGTQLGTLAIRRDRFGLQVAGAVHMDVPREALNRVIAAAPSGDWRDFLFFDVRWQRGALALFGIHIVNTPGFPVRQRQVASGGLRLVASAAALETPTGSSCGCGGHGAAPSRADRLARLASLDRAAAIRSQR